MASPNMFKAAVLVETGAPVVIMKAIKAPVLNSGQVLVKIQFAGVCHSQLMEVRGGRGKDAYLPHFLGHEGVGKVIEIGEGVSKLKIGDEVILGWIKGEGIEAGGCQYRDSEGRIINSGAVTTFSEYAVVSENRLVIKPPHTPSRLAVLYGCALPTGAGLVFNELKPKPKSNIGVLGLGGIGLSALMAMQQFEPSTLIAIDVEDNKLELARSLGATHTINTNEYTFSDVKKNVLDLTGGQGLDYVVEAAGLVKTIELGFDLIRRKGGELIFASHPQAGEKISPTPPPPPPPPAPRRPPQILIRIFRSLMKCIELESCDLRV